MERLRGIIEKYNSLSVTVKASLWFTICSLLQKGMQFFTVPIFTRIMTTEEYGYVTLYQSWLSVLTVICTLNITYGGFYNGMIKYKDDKDGYTSSVLFLTTIMTLAWFIVYFLFRNNLQPVFGLSHVLMCLMFIEILSKSAYDVWITRQKYEFNYRKQTVITVICSTLTPAIGVFFVLTMENKILGRILSFVVVYLVLGVFLYIIMITKSKRITSAEYWKFSVCFCIPLIPHFLSQTILVQSDRIMINNMIGTSEAAIYGFSYNIAMILTIVYQAVNNSFIPWLYRKLEIKDYKSIDNTARSLLLLIAVLSVATSLFAPEAVLILGGRQYYSAIYVIPPVITSVFFMFLYSLFCNVEAYYEKNQYVMIASLIAALLNLVLNYLFIPKFGFIAAGYTTLICYIVLSISHYVCMKIVCKKEKINEDIFELSAILMVSGVVISFSLVSTMLYANTIIRYMAISVIVIVGYIKRSSILALLSSIKKG